MENSTITRIEAVAWLILSHVAAINQSPLAALFSVIAIGGLLLSIIHAFNDN